MASRALRNRFRNTCCSLLAEPRTGGNPLGKLFHNLDLRRLQGMRHQRQRFFHHAIQIHVGQFARAGARKIQQVVDDLAGAEGLLDDFFDDGVPGIIFRHLFGQHLDVI